MFNNIKDIIKQYDLSNNYIANPYNISFVYFITDKKYVKIGVAKNINLRLKQLQTGNGNILQILAAIPCKNNYDAHYLEKQLHYYFSQYNTYGEWFDILDFLSNNDNYIIQNYNIQTMAVDYQDLRIIVDLFADIIALYYYKQGFKSTDKFIQEKINTHIVEELKFIEQNNKESSVNKND